MRGLCLRARCCQPSPWFPSCKSYSSCPATDLSQPRQMCLHLQLSLEMTRGLLGQNGRAASRGERPGVHPLCLCQLLILGNSLHRGSSGTRARAPCSRHPPCPQWIIHCWGLRGSSAAWELTPGRDVSPSSPGSVLEQRAACRGGCRSVVLCGGPSQRAHPAIQAVITEELQPRGSEKQQITAQAPSSLIKILSLAKPPTPAQPVPISAAGQGGQRAGLLLMKRKHYRAFKCHRRWAALAGTVSSPGSVTGGQVTGW